MERGAVVGMSKERNFRFTVEVQMYTNEGMSDEELASSLIEFGTDACADVFDEIVNVESLPTKEVQREELINKTATLVAELAKLDYDEGKRWVLVQKTEDGNTYEF